MTDLEKRLTEENARFRAALKEIRNTFVQLALIEKYWRTGEVNGVAEHWIAKIDALKTPAHSATTEGSGSVVPKRIVEVGCDRHSKFVPACEECFAPEAHTPFKGVCPHAWNPMDSPVGPRLWKCNFCGKWYDPANDGPEPTLRFT